jgi:hypothetical protein
MILALALAIQDHQLTRIPDGQGSDHNRVHDAVDRSIYANPQRERQHCHNGEQRVPA